MGRTEDRKSGRGAEERGGRDRRPDQNLEDRSVDELRQLAGELNIEDRYRMDRDELIQAIEREDDVESE